MLGLKNTKNHEKFKNILVKYNGKSHAFAFFRHCLQERR